MCVYWLLVFVFLFFFFFFFFNDTATTEIYTLSLHDALPISCTGGGGGLVDHARQQRCSSSHGVSQARAARRRSEEHTSELRHPSISYAVFCLKKKTNSATTNAYSINPYGQHLK